MIHNRLKVFISSTAELECWRDAVERTLLSLEIDPSRFESWPSSSNAPLKECLARIDESEAFVLLLGKRYGPPQEEGLSATHHEYRRARARKVPTCAFMMKMGEADPKQCGFITEVRRDRFLCRSVQTIDELESQVRNSFLEAFVRSFRQVHTLPMSPMINTVTPATFQGALPERIEEVRHLLADLYKRGDDTGIRSLAEQCEKRFADDLHIMNIILSAEVNLGINGVETDRARVAKAVGFWNRMLDQKCGPEAEILYNLGNALAVLRRFDAAIEQYQAALKEQPLLDDCWKNLGAVYIEKDDWRNARRCFDQALSINPRLPEALYSLATLTIREGRDPEEALAWMNRIASACLSPNLAAAVHSWMADLCRRLGRYPEGIASAENALATAPGAEWAWMVAARLYSLVRHQSSSWLPAAIDFWHRFTSKYPHIEEAWAELGYSFWSLGDLSDPTGPLKNALPALCTALELGYNDEGLIEDRIGHICQAQGNWQVAEVYYRKAFTKNQAQFGYCLGVSLLFLERYAEALPLLEQAAMKHQPDALSWFQLALCHEGLGDLQKSIKAYERALQLDKGYADAWFNLGGILWNSGDRKRAFKIWQRACRRFPDHKRAK